MNRSKTNTWRTVQGKKPLKSMEDIVAQLQGYVKTYSDQVGYKEFSDELFIDDILYGLGIALDKKYEFGNGYIKFQQRLKEHLDGKTS